VPNYLRIASRLGGVVGGAIDQQLASLPSIIRFLHLKEKEVKIFS